MFLRSRVLTLVLVLFSAGLLARCADTREPTAREHLQNEVASQSAGALALATMKSTNGFKHERDGMKLYTIEWEATLQISADGWKAGWRDFQVLPQEPNALGAAVEGLSVKRVLRGGTATLQGKSELQKADRGWRVLAFQVTASKLTSPPDSPTEGRSTDIAAFTQGFKAAVQSRDKNTLAKFIAFPTRSEWMVARTESEFLAGAFPFDDTWIQAIVAAGDPRQHEDGSCSLATDQFAINFTKNRDGYWKWTDFYLAEGE